MTPFRLFGAILKRMVLRPRVRRLTWEQLCSGAAMARERFDQMIAGETDATAAIAPPGELSILEILAQVAAEERRIAARLDDLRTGTRSAGVPAEPEPASLEEARRELAAAWRRVGEAAATPISGDGTAPHALFGPLNAREWVALITYQLEYHARRIDRLRQSGLYRQAQGAKW